jgi:hypothetical protein
VPAPVTEEFDQVALRQKNSDEDINRCHRREQQVAHRHDRCCPECDDEAEIDRVAHEPVEQRGAEARGSRGAAGEMMRHLLQAEQLEVIDQEPAGQHVAHHSQQ